MDTQQLIIIGIVVLVVIVAILLIVSARKRKQREELRSRYGQEYDRTVRERGSKRAAVKDLQEREALHSELALHDLNEADRDLVRRHMASLQYRFVEDPDDVMLSTQRVMTEVLRARGYPVAEDRDKALRLFSVDYPQDAGPVRTVVEGNYGGDVSRMQEAFIGARRTLADVAGVSYVLGDATDEQDQHMAIGGSSSTSSQAVPSAPASTAPGTASADTPSGAHTDAPSGAHADAPLSDEERRRAESERTARME
jgi:hypothetical protein